MKKRTVVTRAGCLGQVGGESDRGGGGPRSSYISSPPQRTRTWG